MTIQKLRSALNKIGFHVPFFAINTWPKRVQRDVEHWLDYNKRYHKNKIRPQGHPVVKPQILERYTWEPLPAQKSEPNTISVPTNGQRLETRS